MSYECRWGLTVFYPMVLQLQQQVNMVQADFDTLMEIDKPHINTIYKVVQSTDRHTESTSWQNQRNSAAV